MDNKVFDKAEEFIADKIKTNTAAIGVTTNSVETTKANKEKAEKKAEKALRDGDVDAYQKAQDAIKKADATITVHGNLLQRLKEEPILPREEYESKVADVLAELERIVSKDREKVVSLIDQIADIAEKEDVTIKRGNAILKKLQHDLYRDADRTRDKTGHVMSLNHENKQFKEDHIRMLASGAINSPHYKTIGGTWKPGNGIDFKVSNMDVIMAHHMQHVTYHNK